MGVILRAAMVTDLGLVRTNNEDSAHVGSRLIAVADGMGGLPAGELASDLVIKALAPLDGAPADADPLKLLTAAVEEGNNRVADMVDEDPVREGMGTTVTALLLSAGKLGLVHVGDSRCYLLRGGRLQRLTRDQTMTQMLVDAGVMPPEALHSHHMRHMLTQAMGKGEVVIDAQHLPLRDGDRLMLSSDGLTDGVSDEQILDMLSRGDCDAACGELMHAALEAGGRDNVTVIVADVSLQAE